MEERFVISRAIDLLSEAADEIEAGYKEHSGADCPPKIVVDLRGVYHELTNSAWRFIPL